MANPPKDQKDEEYTEAETEQRMKDALKRALSTPPEQHKASGNKPKKGTASTKKIS